MNEDHVIVEEEDVEDCNSKVQEEGQINTDYTRTVPLVVVIVHGEGVSLMPAHADGVTQEDKCEVK